MLPELSDGDLIIYSRQFYGPLLGNKRLWIWKKAKPGELIVFYSKKENKIIVKRCAAIEGDPVEYENGSVRIGEIIFTTTPEMNEYFKQYKYVPGNCLFLLGDNSKKSIDSRYLGFVSMDDVRGKVVYISRRKDDN